MSIDRELLRQAWPDGYLAMRGVRTIGGWQCVDVEERGHKTDSHWVHPEVNTSVLSSLGKGIAAYAARFNRATDLTRHPDGFLPNVDPSDTATWACLLRDLANALGQDEESGYIQSVPSWGMTTRTTRGGTDFYVNGINITLDETTDDPALALVLARIQLRKEGA